MTVYDQIQYPSYTHAQTHPDQLATKAMLFGMTPAPVERNPGVLDTVAAERKKLLETESAELVKQADQLAVEIAELTGQPPDRVV